MTDVQIDALAQELLKYCIIEILGWDRSFFFEVYDMEEGGLVPVYAAESEEGHGAFVCEFMPLATIKTIIIQCEQIFDKFKSRMIDKATEPEAEGTIDKYLTNARDLAIRGMAKSAALNLIAFFQAKVCNTLEEAIEDCKLMAYVHVATAMALQFNEVAPGAMTVDLRSEIEEAAMRVAEKKRATLRDHIKELPHMITKRGPGAPLKSPFAREIEREKYSAEVEAAYRKLREKQNAKPTKTSIAKALGAGGVNPTKGSQTYLQVFNAKLKRLTIDYKAIVEKVDKETNKKNQMNSHVKYE